MNKGVVGVANKADAADRPQIAGVCLPVDFSRPPVSSYLREQVDLAVSTDLSAQLDALALPTLLGALAAQLVRYGNGRDVVMTTEVKGQPIQIPVAVPSEATLSSLREQIAAKIEGRAEGVVGTVGLAVGADEDAAWIVETDLFFGWSCPDGHWQLCCAYNAEVMTADTCRLIGQQYLNVLSGGVEQPFSAVLALPIACGVADFATESSRVFERPGTLLELFRESVVAAPEAIAVADERRELSYAALDERSNQIAGFLLQHVDPGDLVAVYMDRSVELVAALLGILKAGAAYLPLDPHYPMERVAYVLEDAAPTAVMVDPELTGQLPQAPVKLLVFGSCSVPSPRPVDPPAPGDLAYVIYTSGSTGRPKGIEIPHAALANFLLSMAEKPGLSGADILVAVTTISFDIAALELFLPLVVGAKVVIADRATAADGPMLADLLAESQATVMQATPVSWELLLSAGWQAKRGFRVLCGGEALSCQLAERLIEFGAALWNLYGPTETTIWSTVHRVTRASVVASGNVVDIGHPIANTTVRVLDDQQRPVPAGVPGELAIGGAGLARGYRNRPELTAEKFCDLPAGRMFRTGDRVRYRADGALVYLGRLDDQVKIRGFRVELGEIEAALRQHPLIVRAAAAVEEQVLRAYLVTTGVDLNQRELRQFLQQTLPDYMVPTSFRHLAALPLTDNGKIDRKSLVDATALEWTQSTGTQRQPRTETERMIADVFQQLLGVEQICVDANFFDLGANSQLVMRAHANLAGRLSGEISIVHFYTYPTISSLAQSLSAAKASSDSEGGESRGVGRRERMLRRSRHGR